MRLRAAERPCVLRDAPSGCSSGEGKSFQLSIERLALGAHADIAEAAVLLVSEDLDELLALADRILVMSNGQIVYETPIQTADVAIIGHHMAAH